ncbi:hypothetical protein [Leptothoe sp. PORK10 BA2]|uniref:hypothetical protein n=1 Tax=Leptothoe sp. PORK10 BA2 TaxID=3110254 RepID=UPI002B1EFDDB|nr:hypothetical protein [Leptothoe sp. PORK10 BA2]MEA5464742.1 hypothetical protein [Leptothoe sp. PORK10 BA2]
MKLNAFIHTETYSVQSIGPCLLELERETGYARGGRSTTGAGGGRQHPTHPAPGFA